MSRPEDPGTSPTWRAGTRAAAGSRCSCRRRSGPRNPKISPSSTLIVRSSRARTTVGCRAAGRMRPSSVAVVLRQAGRLDGGHHGKATPPARREETEPMPKTVPQLPGIDSGDLPFSQIVEAGGLVFIAGQVGSAPGGHGAVPGGIEAETRAMLDNVGRVLHAAGLDYTARRQGDGLPRRLRRLRDDERRLPRVLPDRAADPGDGRRHQARVRLPDRDRGHRHPLIGVVQRLITSSSMATIGWPRVPTTSIVSVWRPADAQRVLNTRARGSNPARCRSTVRTSRPSIETRAWPRVGPTGPYQRIPRPVNVNVALAPRWVV